MGTRRIKSNHYQGLGFSLVEIIVIITILAILGTIALIAFQWHASSARDSARLSDISSIKMALGLHYIKSSSYPLPSEPLKTVTYSGWIAFYEWEFWDSVIRQLQNLNKAPVDPRNDGVNYTYSITNHKKQYQIGFVSENELANLSPIIETAMAANAVPQIEGTYTGAILVLSGSTSLVLNTPTIITTDSNTGTMDIVSLSGSFVYDGNGTNLPFSYKNTAVASASTPESPTPPSSSGAVSITFSESDGTTVNCADCTTYP